MDIYNDITGRFIGKLLAVIHLIWLVMLTALYVRYFAIRLVGSVYPNVSIEIFIISMLAVIAYTLRNGITVLARFNEITFPLLTGVFYMLILLMLPNIKFNFLTPVSYRSILPVFEGSVGTIGILAYFTFLFIIGDKINNKEKIKKAGVSVALFTLATLMSLIGATLGTFSYSVTQRTRLPFLIAVKQISLFNTIEKIESIVVAFWVLSDFVLISFFIICTLHILKSMFKLSDTKPVINIYLILMYFLSMFLAKSVFEMERLSINLFIPGNIAIGIMLPVVIFIIGKIRKKV
jgi:spore germination protein (amino acid permease)